MRSFNLLFTCALSVLLLSMSAYDDGLTEEVTVLLRAGRDCGASAYFGERLKAVLEPGEEVSLEAFSKMNNGLVDVPIGAKQEIVGAPNNLSETKILVLEGLDCGRSGSLAADVGFWGRQMSRGLQYIAESRFDGDGFVWHLVNFTRKLKEGDRVIVYVSADVYLARDGYYILFSDFDDYVDKSDYEQSVRQHGYPLMSLLNGLRALKPSKLNIIIDGLTLTR